MYASEERYQGAAIVMKNVREGEAVPDTMALTSR